MPLVDERTVTTSLLPCHSTVTTRGNWWCNRQALKKTQKQGLGGSANQTLTAPANACASHLRKAFYVSSNCIQPLKPCFKFFPVWWPFWANEHQLCLSTRSCQHSAVIFVVTNLIRHPLNYIHYLVFFFLRVVWQFWCKTNVAWGVLLETLAWIDYRRR